ncbi:hypothetical protein GF314_15940 [bacterium]|nr:hypothetical protein [bacterium]
MVALLLLSLVINEVCYDPEGADGGAEFVELWNAGTAPAALGGVALEFANGAHEEPSWDERWRATAGTTLAPGAVLLIVDRGWEGPPAAAEVPLGLQNGPDALRLVGPEGTLDLVGWGDLAQTALYEGEPAPDVSGEVLARRPDGHDTDDNAADFRGHEPTPGRANWAAFAPTVIEVRCWPPSAPRPGEPVTTEVLVANGGLETLARGRLVVTIGPARGQVALPPLPPDAAATVAATVVPVGRGLLPLIVRVFDDAVPDSLDHVHGAYRVGLPEVRLSEVMAAPVAGGEWCEIENTDSVPRGLSDLRLRDEDGTWRALPAADLAPGACRLVARDADDVVAWLAELADAGMGPACEVADVVEQPGWPGLNNTAPSSRTFADCLYLGDAEGNVLDHLVLGAASGEAPDGRSLERGADGRWRLATATAGATPGCAAAGSMVAGDATLRLAPNPFDPGRDPGAVRFSFRLPPEAVGWELRIFDLWGHRVRDLGGDSHGPGPREVAWDGRDSGGAIVPVGGYVALLGWRTAGGGMAGGVRRLVVVRREGP